MTLEQATKNLCDYSADYTPQPVVQTLFAALGCAQTAVAYVPVVGTAGKTCVASLEESILRAAGFSNTGCYLGGVAPLYERILVGGKRVPASVFHAAVAALAQAVKTLDAQSGAVSVPKSDLADAMLDQAEEVAAEFGFKAMQSFAVQPSQEAVLSLTAAEFLIACHCFTASHSEFAVVELPEPEYAALFRKMPACAITQLGIDAQGHSALRAAKAACGVLRKGTSVVTSPAQSADVLTEIITAAKQEGCLLCVPDLDDFTEKHHRRLQNRMDYGGYEVMLPYLGVHATHNAAIAIELALALWRKGTDISDEAILEGLSLAENSHSILPLARQPMLVVDACHNPMQAAAFAQWVAQADCQAISLVVGFDQDDTLEDIFSALETGVVVDRDKIEKQQMPGMSDNAFDKVYAVTVDGATAVGAQQVVQRGRFHFDIEPCANIAEALKRAQADNNEGVAVCGSPALVQAVKKYWKSQK